MNRSVTAGSIPSSLIDVAASRPGDDPIFALNAEARERARAGERVVNATLGALMEDDGRLAVLPTVFEVLREVPMERAAAYAPIAGEAGFLEAVRRDLFGTEGIGFESSVAAATPGGTGALHHAIVNFLEPGQALLTTDFFWGPYRILASHTRRAVETFETFDAEGRFDLHAFEAGLAHQIARQGRSLVIFNFPCHNPTGYTLDEGEWARVAEIVERHGQRAPVAFLIDLAYAEFGAPGSNGWRRQLERLTSSATVLLAWTVSKSMAQYGARIGALVGVSRDAEERERMANAFSYSCRGTWSNCNHLGQLAVERILSEPALHERVKGERERLVQLLGERVETFNELARAAGLSWPRYEGGFFVSVFTPDAERTAETMRKEGVFVVPMKGAVRVAICSTPKADLPLLVEALGRGVRAAGEGR